MANKPTYEELEQRVKELENETFEWKQAEKVLKGNELKLRVSEQELNSILHHSPDIIYRLNPAGEITYINDIAKEYGYSREDLIGKNILEFVHPDDREKAVHRIDERRTGDRSTKSYEIRLLRKDLDYVPFENKSRGFGDFLIDAEGIYSSGKPEMSSFVGTQGIARDIFERKQAEDALRESEEQYKSLVESTDDSIYLLNKDGIYLFVNEKHLSRLGCSGAKEVIGKTYGDFHPLKDTKEFLGNIGEAIKTGETTQLEHKSYRDNRYFLRTLSPVKNSEGHITSVTVVSKEISEIKKAEEAQRESEKRFRYLADASMEAIFFTQRGICLEANQIAAEMFGYDDRSEFIGMFGTEIIAPESHEIVKEHMLKNIFEPYEAVGKRKDGTRFPIAIRAKEMPYQDKGMVRATSIMDISDRKRTEEELKAAETTYRNIFRNSQIGLFRTDMNTGLLLDANDAVAQFIGYKDRNDLLSKPFNIAERYVDPKDREKILSLLKANGEFRNYEARYRRNDGTIIWMRFSARIVPEKGWMEGVSEDITDQKLFETSLLESEEKHRTILETIEDGYFEIDIAGNLTLFNGSLCEILGYSKDELIGMNNRQFTDEENAKKLYQTFNRVYTTGKSDKGFDWKIIRKDGNKRFVEASISLKKGSEGQPIGFQGIVRDVSDRRQIEKDKAKLEARLQQAQKMEAIGTLAGGVAHDLNNILGGLVSYPELLLLQLPEDSPLRKSILTIQKSGEKATAVVQDLLTLARRGVVTTEVVNLNMIIDEYLQSPEHENLQAYHPGVHIETHLEKDTLNILGSPTHLSKTVMNLVSNAAEAMPEGGKLTVSTENRYIDRPIRGYDNVEEGDYVVLTISDTGTGIALDDMAKIFEPFYTKKKMGRSGTGLGMAVVWGTVKDHNGYIHVQSTEGKGTTFTLYFPVTRKSLEETSDISLKDYMGNSEAILVVDDVEEQRKIASGMLKELGYSVVSVASGEEAVEYLKINKADLLVLDMIMDPGMDGLETYKKILEIYPRQKAIIASGFSETDRVKEVQSLGAGAYIRKPLLLAKVGLAVKEELER